MNLTVNELLLAFLQDRSFAGRLVNALPHVSQPGMGTMAIGIHGQRLALFTDPEFIKRVSLPFGHFVMEHEISGHYAHAHIPRFLEFLSRYSRPEDRQRCSDSLQIAADCAANDQLRKTQHFERADKETREYAKWAYPGEELKGDEGGMILPERFGLPAGKSFEFYLNELMQRSGVGSRKKGGKEDSFYQEIVRALRTIRRNHAKWPGLGDELKTMSPEEIHSLAHQLHNQTKHVLRKVAKEMKQGRGTLPGDLVEWLDEYLKEPIIPWYEMLISRIHATRMTKVERGVYRPNRILMALAEEDPGICTSIGQIKNPTWRGFYVEDVSGSMGTESCKIGKSELQHLLNSTSDMELREIQFDAGVHVDRVFKQGDAIPADAHGRGGTDFDAVFQYMQKYVHDEETAPDFVVIFTDGGAPAVRPENYLPPEIPIIWCITPDGSGGHLKEAKYGEVIVCDPEHNELYSKEEV